MGRGRAKAKQVKVARQLKYSGGGTDLDRLRAELGVGTDQQEADGRDVHADFGDRYAGPDEEPDDDELDDDDLDDYEDAAGPAGGYAGGTAGAPSRLSTATGVQAGS